MPLDCTSRKRGRSRATAVKEENAATTTGDVEHKKELPSAPKPKPESKSLASKLKKRMLEDPTQEQTAEKHLKTEGDDAGVSSDSAKDVLCNIKVGHCGPSALHPTSFHKYLQGSHNIVHTLYTARLGIASSTNKKSLVHPLVRELQDLILFRTANPFDRRVTTLEWHPSIPNMVVAGSKGGDLIFWNTLHQNLNDNFIQGIGAGGSIQALKVWPWNSECVLTASIDGQVMIRDCEQKQHQILLDTGNCIHCWFCCVDVSAPRKIVVTGDNIGHTLLLSMDGKQLWSHRLHKQKVTHAEFSPREDWLLCTASTDMTVKVWDIRKISGRDSALEVLKHDKPVNSAYFSRTDGCRLLTTDQCNQIRVYLSPSWHLERTISHPHRFFQHITPIKAAWHPLQDLIVVGRYPSKDFPGYTEDERRTIDIIDVDNGNMVCQLHDPSAPGIVSLNKFSARGDYLVSGMGTKLLLWGRSQEVEERQRSLLADHQISDFDLERSSGRCGVGNSSRNPRHHPSAPKKTKSKKETDVKMKVTTKTKTEKKSST